MAFTPNFPSGVATNSPTSRSFISDLQLLVPHCYPEFIKRYGNQNYTWLLEAMGLKEVVAGRDFFHFESYGKLHQAISAATSVTPGGAGQSVIVTLSAADHYQSGTMSPARIGETVRVDSSGFEGKVIAINTSTPSAHTMTILPLKSSVTFTSEGSSQLLAGEVLTFMGDTEAGEASTQINGMSPITEQFTNSTTEIRDDYEITDRAMLEEIFVEFQGRPYYTYLALEEMTQRFANNREFKLMRGDIANNLSAYGGSVGTQGLIPRIQSDGQNTQYTPGQLSISEIQNIIRGFDFYGSAQEYHWLCDSYQYDELMNSLFQTYNSGAIVWDYAGKSQEAAVNYGFSSLAIGGGSYTLHFKKYLPFNSEAVWGKASSNSQFRNFGILIPMKEWIDPVQHVKIPTIRVVYNSVPDKPEIISLVTGGLAPVPTDSTAHLVVSTWCYAGIEAFAANTFQIVSA